MGSYTRLQLEAWLKTIQVPIGSKVLDVGGSEYPVRSRLTKIGENCEFYILDLERPHKCKQKPDIICDLNVFQLPEEHYINNFDIIFCLEVSEYWWNPIAALKNIRHFLNHKGILYISFHFLYPEHEPFDQDFLRYTEPGVVELLSRSGFQIKDIRHRMARFPGNLNNFYKKEGMPPSKKSISACVGHLITAVKKEPTP